MKKMNFYFNFGRCCTLLLPALLFLTGTTAFAGASNNTPFLPGFKSGSLEVSGKNSTLDMRSILNVVKVRTMAVAPIAATLSGTNAVGAASPTISVTIPAGGIGGYAGALSYEVLIFDASGTQQNGNFMSPVFPNSAAVTANVITRNVAPGTYFARIVVRDFNNLVIENAVVSTAGVVSTIVPAAVPTDPVVAQQLAVADVQDPIITTPVGVAAVANCPAGSFAIPVVGENLAINPARQAALGLSVNYGSTVVGSNGVSVPVSTVNFFPGVAPSLIVTAVVAPVAPSTTFTVTVQGTDHMGNATGVAGAAGSINFPNAIFQFQLAPDNVAPTFTNAGVALSYNAAACGAIAGPGAVATAMGNLSNRPAGTLIAAADAVALGLTNYADLCNPAAAGAQFRLAAATPVFAVGGNYTIGVQAVDLAPTPNVSAISNVNVTIAAPVGGCPTGAATTASALTCPGGNDAILTTSVVPVFPLQPYRIRVQFFNAGLVQVGADVISGTNPALPFVANSIGVPAGAYSSRTFIESTTGVPLEATVNTAVVVAPGVDAAAPAITGGGGAVNINSIAGVPACTTPVFLQPAAAANPLPRVINAAEAASLGVNAVDACTGVTYRITAIGAVGAGGCGAGFPVTVTATDAAAVPNVSAAAVVCVTLMNPPMVVNPDATQHITGALPTIAACATTTTLNYGLVAPTGGCGAIVIEDVIGLATGTTVSAGTYVIQARWRDATGTLTPYVTRTFVIIPAPAAAPLVCGAFTNNTPRAIAACATTTTLNYTIAAPTGGCAPITLLTTGGLPTGTVVTAGTYTFVNTYRDAAGTTLTCTNTITVDPAPAAVPLACGAFVDNTPDILACATTTVLNYTMAAPTGGCGAIALVASSGPANGTAVTAGSYTIVRQYRDASGATLTCTNEITVDPAPADLTPPTLFGCPVSATQNYVAACGGRATINYATPTATDNCPGNPVPVIVQTGPVSGSQLDAGVYPVIFTATDAAGNATTCSFTITVTNPAPTSLACIGGSATSPGVNITLDATCTTVIRPNHVVISCIGNESDYSVVVKTLGGSIIPNATVGSAQIGKVVRVEVTYVPTGVTCWGYALIEDKTAPSIVCPRPVTLLCGQVGSIGNLLATGQFLGATNAVTGTQALIGGATNGTTNECSKYTQSYTDVANWTQCAGGTVTRTWQLKDQWNNVSITCVQIITITAAPIFNRAAFAASIVHPTLQCQNVSAAALAALLAGTDNVDVTGDGTADNFIPALTGCGLSIRLSGSRRVEMCQGSYKILRTWEVTDMCAPLTQMFSTYEQVIQVLDQTAPTGMTTWQNYGVSAGTYCFYMQGMKMIDQPNQEITAGIPVTAVFGAAAINLRPRADENMCNAAPIFFSVVGADENCSNGNVTWASSDARITFSTSASGTGSATVSVTGGTTVFVKGFFMKTSAVDPTFNVTATDACGNVRTQTYNVIIIDNVSPQPVCIQSHRATLNSNGTARVNAATFNNGSSDNCGIERFHVRRMDKRNPVTATETPCDYTDIPMGNCTSTDIRDYWNDYVDFDCGDAGRTVMVAVLYIDAAGNFSQCMVNVTVDDKTTPVCVRAADIEISCADNRLLSYSPTADAGIFTTPAAYDNCGIVSITLGAQPATLSLTCNSTQLTRTWTFTDCSNNSVSCTQKLTVTPTPGFRANTLPDSTYTCVSAYSLEANRQQIIRSLQLRYTAGFNGVDMISNPDGAIRTRYAGRPINATQADIFGTATCAGPVVEATDWTYSNTEFCKVYVQTFTIKDICAFSSDNSGNSYGGRISNAGSVNAANTVYTPSFATGLIQSQVVNGFHIIRFTRTIFIKDTTAPTSNQIGNIVICDNNPAIVAPANALDTDADACEFGFTQQLNGSDLCATAATSSSLFYTWTIEGAGLTTISGIGITVSANNLRLGVPYTVRYRVADLCGNISTPYIFTVTGNDCKAPEILLHVKVVALAGQTGAGNGMARLLYTDIRNRITDNCDGDITNSSDKTIMERVVSTDPTNPTAPRTLTPNGTTTGLIGDGSSTDHGLMFTCADGPFPATKLVRVWARDAAGNWNYAQTTITVQDNDGICTARPPVVAGTVGTENNSPVKDVVVSASANGIVAGSATTPALGSFSVTGLTPGTNVQVRAAKTIDTDKKNGVTTLDIALISKHLLAVESLNSPYKIISADVNKDGFVDATDMLYIRRFILNITPTLPAGAAWRFVDKSYNFRDASNPLAEDFSEVVNLSSIPTGTTAANFTAVKLGDVNNSFDAAQVRGSRVLAFNATDMDVVAGNEYTVAINAENFNASAFQGTFAFTGATVKAVKAGNLNNLSDANFGMFGSEVSASWNGKASASADVVNITFVAAKSGKLSDMLTVNSAVTMAEGYDAAGNAMNVTLKFNTGKVAGGEFALYQNTPNPVALSTKIGFNLPKDGQAKLTIYTTEGKVLSVINNGYKAGYNEVTINKSDLNASGMLYYRLDTQDNSSTRKMIIIE